MDDQTNSKYSRAPELEDLIFLCRSLNEADAKYILIGGFAVILHGFVRGTKDIDLLVDPAEENIKKIKKAMSRLPDNAISLIEDNEVQKYSVIRIADEFVVDLLGKACSVDYNNAIKEVEYKELQGVRIPIPKKEKLIEMKDTIRPHDKTDTQFLKTRIEEEKKLKLQK